ncbi:hypothetical protein [Paenibacillus sp. OSY-SE]|uniref:hypothetical protein n=1 Tax=Paenibacillus sp. OSY-SE TaxID=1196323 RepID=UPI0012FB7C1A|nr:hypothetical protein [Paenibacillus sp. OSY-SE]
MEKQANHARGQFINRIRLANTYQWNKEFQKSNEIFDVLVGEFHNQADESLQDIEDFLYQHMGKNKFEQGEYEEAPTHFYKTLEIRLVKNNSELIESTQLAIDATLKMHNE